MIAEDYFSIDETTVPAGRTASARQNRNLSSIVSTIRDDGPSTAEAVRSLHNDGADGSHLEDTVEISAPRRQRVRALPGMAVMSKVLVVLILAIFIGGTALLATGKYPHIDNNGLQLADLPGSAVAEMVLIKAGVQETFSQWLAQARLIFSAGPAQTPDMRVSAATELVAMEERQQQIMNRLDTLAAAMTALQSRYERDQNDRLAESTAHRTEQDLQLQDVQAQLTKLQQQLASDKASPVVSRQAAQVDSAGQSLSAAGGWVVNVASSSQEEPVKHLQQQLGKKGIATVMKRVDSNGGPRYRLRVTGFSTSGEAKRYAEKLAQEHDLQDAWASAR